jgi:hypothetical protein
MRINGSFVPSAVIVAKIGEDRLRVAVPITINSFSAANGNRHEMAPWGSVVGRDSAGHALRALVLVAEGGRCGGAHRKLGLALRRKVNLKSSTPSATKSWTSIRPSASVSRGVLGLVEEPSIALKILAHRTVRVGFVEGDLENRFDPLGVLGVSVGQDQLNQQR